jgi:hypothetical protein
VTIAVLRAVADDARANPALSSPARRLGLIDDLIVLDLRVKIDERRNGVRLDDGVVNLAAGEGSNGVHGFPAGQHEELNSVAEKTSAQMRADKSGRITSSGTTFVRKWAG